MFSADYRYGTGTLTKVFMDRVFQECLTYDGEMDYKTYLDFVLAMENRHEPQSLQYLFRILDINNKGYLDTFCLNYFFRVSISYGNSMYKVQYIHLLIFLLCLSRSKITAVRCSNSGLLQVDCCHKRKD
jgi:Ca2+-binding EF-hand superfamily protein